MQPAEKTMWKKLTVFVEPKILNLKNSFEKSSKTRRRKFNNYDFLKVTRRRIKSKLTNRRRRRAKTTRQLGISLRVTLHHGYFETDPDYELPHQFLFDE